MRLDVVLDGRTANLIAAARATKAAEHLPTSSARSLVALATGARLYLQANLPDLAERCLVDIDVLILGAEGSEYRDIRDAYARLVTEVRKGMKGPAAPAHTTPAATR